MSTTLPEPVPFSISVTDDQLDDLRQRLAATRWPEASTVDDWSQGTPLGYLQELCQYWLNEYDWRQTETRLNRSAHQRIAIDDLDIHYVHHRSPEPGALPLIITHGWPGSFLEFEKVVGPLSDPASHGGDPSDAFHVVCPSLPGFGLSGKPTTTGWGVEKVAETWSILMAALGYERYGAQGGDWGSAVTTAVGGLDGEHCIGIHTNMPVGRGAPSEQPDASEQRALDALAHYADWDSGYSKQQATRPQTIGYALTDSPVGQAAWIVEKYWAWTDCDGHPENALTKDEMIDNIMLYWLNAAAASSARLYWESFGQFRPKPVEIPTGVAAFPKEILPSTRSWAEKTYRNIVQWTEMPRGGHFAAWEQPDLYVDDVRSFFRALR